MSSPDQCSSALAPLVCDMSLDARLSIHGSQKSSFAISGSAVCVGLLYLQLDHSIQKELSVKAVLHSNILLQDVICGQAAVSNRAIM